ncbi:MAG: lysophospholipid acyltransferase family protein [Acutalibacteraceae bacterium]
MKEKKLGKFVRLAPPATEKFDLQKPMMYQRPAFMKYAVWPVAKIRSTLCGTKTRKVNMENIEAPFILVCNHNAFYDFWILMSCMKPYRAVFPAAVDDFIGRELPFRFGGCIPKRKYTTDLNTVLQCKKALADGQSFGIFVEARYCLCGVTENDAFTDSVGQLVKLMNVPCVTLKISGNHIYDPFWGDHKYRDLKRTEGVLTQIFTKEEVEKATAEEINAKIRESIYNDDWRWQSENRLPVKYKKRAEGLHKPLYQCPHCMTEYKMNSKGDTIYCEHCGKRWKLNYYGELEAQSGKTEFKFPSDWYDWERQQVKKEVCEGRYRFECDCIVNDLPNSKGFIRLGKARLTHDMNGFLVEGIREWDGEPFRMKIDAAAQNSLHVEYKYRYGDGKDCIDLNTLKDTWYVFPENCEFSVTKLSLATEQIYKEIWRQRESRAPQQKRHE